MGCVTAQGARHSPAVPPSALARHAALADQRRTAHYVQCEMSMSSFISRRVRLVAPLVAALLLSIAGIPAMAQSDGGAQLTPEEKAAQMYLEVSNPSSGDSIHVGAYMMEGMAFDRAADEGAGIDHVEIFLDNRDTGGLLIGTGQMGAPSPVPDDPQLSEAGWSAQVNVPRNMVGPRTMFVYTMSSITGGEVVIGIPVVVVP
jgi:hypothetical protein